MTVLLRQADVASGNARGAVQWARELAEYVNEQCPELKMAAYYEIYGHSGRIYWIAEAASVGVLDSEFERIASDAGYQQRLSVSLDQGLFAPDSVRDVLLREA